MSENGKLPKGWLEVTLEQVATIHDYLRIPLNSEERSKREGPYPYYGATGKIDCINKYRLDGEYVLLGEDGAPFFDSTKNKAYMICGKSWVNNHAHVLKGIDGVCINRFLMHALNYVDYHGYVIRTTRLKLTRRAMKKLPLRLPPEPEQHRIVAKIEELFSDLDAGVAGLQRVKANLKRYRASVLKAAVSGKLTEKWRARNKDVQPASELLQQILSERRKNWEQSQLARFAAFGKKPPKGWQDKYPVPVQPDTANLPALPKTWCWATVEQIGDVVTGSTPSTSRPEYLNGHLPFFKPADLNSGYYVNNAKDSLTQEGANIVHLLPPKTILIICVGATIGKTGFTRVTGATNQQINAIIPLSMMLPEWIFWIFSSPYGQKQVISNASATTLPILNKSRFERLFVPIPPAVEQEHIVQEIEQRLSIVDEAEALITVNLARSSRLRQSILKKAFEGKLVPQNPKDQPAEVLLQKLNSKKMNNG